MRMSRTIQNRIVSIALPLNDGRHEYFSGYILGDGIILTCLHGFEDAEGRYDQQRKLVIASQGFHDEILMNGEGIDKLRDESGGPLLLFSSKEYDIALLQYAKARADFDGLQLSELDKKGEWDAGGYPRYNINNGTAGGYENFSGVFNPAVATEHFLKLKITNPELDEMANWREVSDSPVFISGKLAGIVSECSTFLNTENK